MTEVLVALIGLAGTIGAVMLPLMWKAHGRRLDAITEQVQNSHNTNLRDDIDRVIAGLDRVDERVATVGMDVAWLRREQLDQAHRLALLEDA